MKNDNNALILIIKIKMITTVFFEFLKLKSIQFLNINKLCFSL